MVFAESSSNSSGSIGVVVGFAFRLAGVAPAEDVTSRGSLQAGDALLGAGRAGSGRVLAVGVRLQKPMPDAGTSFVVAKPD